MLRFLLAILCLTAPLYTTIASQNMVILDQSTDNFPEVSVNYFIFDDTSVLPQHDVNASQITVLDNGVSMPVMSHTNYTGNINKILSLDLCIDLGLNESNGHLKYGLDIANYLIDNLDYSNAELALSAFDTYTFLYKDFSQDKSILSNALSSLEIATGSDLSKVFTTSPGSIVKVFEKGQFFKKSIIITDGNSKISLSAAEKQAYLDNNIQLNIISLGNSVSADLYALVESTGGKVMQNITEDIPALDIARTILALLYDLKPANMSWDASSSCDDIHNTEIYIPAKNSDGNLSYFTPVSSKRRIAALPTNLRFAPILPGGSLEKEVVLEAVNGDITIESITLENDVLFDILEGEISSTFVLSEGSKHTVKVSYTPVDSTIQFTKLLINSSACVGNEVLISAGFPNTPPKEKTIRLTSPLCNETLILGEEHFVEWEGLLPEDVIQLEYSLDDGKTWLPLDSNIRGLKYKWNLPQIETDDALVRIIQLWPNNVGQTMDFKHWAQVNCANFNKFGDRVVTASGDSTAIVWNSNTGVKILTLDKHMGAVTYSVFSDDGKYIATSSLDSTVILWDATTGDSLRSFRQDKIINSVNFSHDSKSLVTACSDGKVKVYDVNTFAEVLNIDAYTTTKRAWYAEFDHTDSYILAAGNSVFCNIYHAVGADKGKVYKSFKVHDESFGDVAHATFNDNSTKVALIVSHLKRAVVWDLAALPDKDTYFLSDSLFSVTHINDTTDNTLIRHASFARDKNGEEFLLTSGTDFKAYIWYASDGTKKLELDEHKNTISTAFMNFDASRVLTASWDSTAKIWNLDKKDLQMDTTDCTFSIKKGRITVNDLAFGDIYRGIVIDSTFKYVIANENSYPVDIKNIELFNDASEQFSLISELDFPITLMPTESLDLEFSVYPKNSGQIKAQMEVLISGNNTVTSTISANVLHEGISVNNSFVDLGLTDFGEFKDSVLTAVIQNNYTQSINISDISIDLPEPDNFRIISGDDITSLSPGQSHTITVRYTPNGNLRNNGVLKVNHDLHNFPARINLLGEGISPIISSCTIYLQDVSGKPGDVISVPVKIKDINEEGIRKTISGIHTYLSFNATLLAPVDTFSHDITADGIRTIGLDLPLNFSEDSTLTVIKFHVGLGNSINSDLTLKNSVPEGMGKFEIKEESAVFTLDGICNEDNPRLFDPYGQSLLSQNSPNPFSTKTAVSFSLQEDSHVSLKVVDMTGKVVLNVIDTNMDEGDHTISIDADQLGSGVYRYLLKTPYQVYSRTMQIIK